MVPINNGKTSECSVIIRDTSSSSGDDRTLLVIPVGLDGNANIWCKCVKIFESRIDGASGFDRSKVRIYSTEPGWDLGPLLEEEDVGEWGGGGETWMTRHVVCKEGSLVLGSIWWAGDGCWLSSRPILSMSPFFFFFLLLPCANLLVSRLLSKISEQRAQAYTSLISTAEDRMVWRRTPLSPIFRIDGGKPVLLLLLITLF